MHGRSPIGAFAPRQLVLEVRLKHRVKCAVCIPGIVFLFFKMCVQNVLKFLFEAMLSVGGKKKRIKKPGSQLLLPLPLYQGSPLGSGPLAGEEKEKRKALSPRF